MLMKKCVISMGMVLAAGAAQADLLNISSGTMHSASNLQGIACTIVGATGPLFQGTKILYVFAESMGNGRDPVLKVSSLRYNRVLQNDDWQRSWYLNGAAQTPVPASLYSTYLRLPKRATDAAVIYFAEPGEAVCAFTNEYAEDSNLYQVQISITDVTSAVGTRSTKSAEAGVVADPGGVQRAEMEHLLQLQSNTDK